MNRIYAGIALSALVALGVWYYGHTRFNAGELSGNNKVAVLTAQHAQVLQHIAELTATASEAARAAEHAQGKELADVATRYEQDKQHAQAAADRTIADLRAGTLRLRQQWTCPAADRVPGAAAGAGIADGGAALRERDAGDLVRLGAEADAQITGLQRALRVCTGETKP